MQKVNSVEEYILEHAHFADALICLRTIINSTELEETIKWNMPTYCIAGKNILGLGAFKNHFCIWFHNGVFLKDKKVLLYRTKDNSAKAMRQMRFKSLSDVNDVAVLNYVKEAIENHYLGRALKPQRNALPLIIPNELKMEMSLNSKLKKTFKALPPSHQREYCKYISEAKKYETKQQRVLKIIPMILEGHGLNDSYR